MQLSGPPKHRRGTSAARSQSLIFVAVEVRDFLFLELFHLHRHFQVGERAVAGIFGEGCYLINYFLALNNLPKYGVLAVQEMRALVVFN